MPLADVSGRADLGGDAEAQRIGRRERIAQHEVALGRQRSEQQRPDRRAAVPGDETDPNVRIDDDGRVGHDDQVAEQRDGRTEPGGRAVQATHDRDLDVEQVPDHLLGLPPQGVGPIDRAQRREPPHVTAGREGRARPVSTTARAVASVFSVRKSSPRSWCSRPSMALTAESGWSMVATRTSPSRSSRIVSTRQDRNRPPRGRPSTVADVRLSVVLGEWLDRPIEADLAVAVEADRLGYGEVWIGEMAKLDVPAMAAAIVARTARIEPVLGPLAVTVRSPAQIALAAATVAATGRRTHVALGTSSDVVARWHGRDRSGAVGRLASATTQRADAARRRAGRRLPPAPAARRGDGQRGGVRPTGRGDRRRRRPHGAQHGDRRRRCALAAHHPNTAAWLAAAVDPTRAERRWLALGFVAYLGAPGYGEMFAAAGFADLVAFARTRPDPKEAGRPPPRRPARRRGRRRHGDRGPRPHRRLRHRRPRRDRPRRPSARHPLRPPHPRGPRPWTRVVPASSACCGASPQQALGGRQTLGSEGGGVDVLVEQGAAERLVELRGDLQVLGRDVGVAVGSAAARWSCRRSTRRPA